MRVCVDIDNTLTRWPDACLGILIAFPESWLLTGYSGPQPIDQDSLQYDRRMQVREYIGDLMRPIHICVGNSIHHIGILKGEFCRDNQIDLLIDDNEIYCKAVRKISPRTAVWRAIQ